MQQAGRLGIGIIGMGRVGPVIGSALRAAGHSIVAVHATSESSKDRADAMLPGVPIEDIETLVERSELVILAVPDDEIAPLVQGLAALNAWQPGQLLVHLSGAHGTSILKPAQQCGAITLAIHPAMTFSGTSMDVARLQGTPFAVTAPATVLPIAQALVVEMGGDPVVVAEENRMLYHAALAHGANYLVTLLVQAQHALQAAGIEDPGAYLRYLSEAALDRALREGTLGITGPISRGDTGTVRAHLDILRQAAQAAQAADTREENDTPPAQALADIAHTYQHMGQATVSALHAAGLLSDSAAGTMRRALDA